MRPNVVDHVVRQEIFSLLSHQHFGKSGIKTGEKNRQFFFFVYFQAGLNSEGKGVIYGYDPVGCIEELVHVAGGAGVTLMQSLLDNQVDKKNQANVEKRPLTLEEAEKLIYDCFISAAEREIHVGDGVCMRIVTKNGIEEKFMALRRD